MSLSDKIIRNGFIKVNDFKEFYEKLKVKLFEDPEPCCMGVRKKDAIKIMDEEAGGYLV